MNDDAQIWSSFFLSFLHVCVSGDRYLSVQKVSTRQRGHSHFNTHTFPRWINFPNTRLFYTHFYFSFFFFHVLVSISLGSSLSSSHLLLKRKRTSVFFNFLHQDKQKTLKKRKIYQRIFPIVDETAKLHKKRSKPIYYYLDFISSSKITNHIHPFTSHQMRYHLSFSVFLSLFLLTDLRIWNRMLRDNRIGCCSPCWENCLLAQNL